jgi:hypothetical protein
VKTFLLAEADFGASDRNVPFAAVGNQDEARCRDCLAGKIELSRQRADLRMDEVGRQQDRARFSQMSGTLATDGF